MNDNNNNHNMRDLKLLFVSIFALLTCNVTFAQTDEEIDAANAAIENNGVYRIYTLFNGSAIGTTKYYLTADGYLTVNTADGGVFAITQQRGEILKQQASPLY